MKIIARLAALAVTCSFATATLAAPAVELSAASKNSVYAQKKAECKQEAKQKHFGVHVLKRNAWIKECIAGNRT